MEDERRSNIIIRLINWLLGLFGDRDSQRDPSGPGDGRQPNEPEPESPSRVDTQIQIVKDAFGAFVSVAVESDTAQYLYRTGHALIADDDVAAVTEYLRSHHDAYGEGGDITGHPADGFTLFALPTRLDGSPGSDLETLREIEDALRPGIVSPDHVIYVTPTGGSLCPATEPNHPHHDHPWPHETRDTDRGQGVQIGVVDTGWWKQAAQDPDAPFLAYGVDGDAEIINPAAIHPYGGHGTFVAGVIRCRAPQAEVTIHGMLTKGGAIFESELMKELDIAVFSGQPPQIVSISGGTHTYNDQPLKTFEALAAKHNLIGNPSAPIIIAAAGNDGSNSPFWPAAFDWVVGVGSLDEDDNVSDYSNYGPWVDVFALGRDHVNAYPTGTYTCYEPPNVGEVRQFKNLAKWSGTSFSTPLVSGQIAAIMTEHGLTAHEAWTHLKAHGVVRTDPTVGKILTMETPGE